MAVTNIANAQRRSEMIPTNNAIPAGMKIYFLSGESRLTAPNTIPTTPLPIQMISAAGEPNFTNNDERYKTQNNTSNARATHSPMVFKPLFKIDLSIPKIVHNDYSIPQHKAANKQKEPTKHGCKCYHAHNGL